MKLQGISLNLVRNEYEYNTVLPKEYVGLYPWAESAEILQPSMPWVVVGYSAVNDGQPSDAELTFGESVDLSKLPASEKWEAGSDKHHLKLHLDKATYGCLMLELKADMGLNAIPAEGLTATVTDEDGNVFTDSVQPIDFTDTEAVLSMLNEQGLQQSDSVAARVLYELIAQGKIK